MKTTVRFCKSHDSVEMVSYFKANRSEKDNRKLSDLKDVYTTDKWKNISCNSEEDGHLRGHCVHLKWKQGPSTIFFLPLPNKTHL